VRVESTHDARKTLILFIVLHVYIVICAVAFQQVEQVKSEGSMHNLNKMAENMSRRFNISLNSSMRLIQQVIYAEKLDGKVEMSKSWSEFSKAFWFVTILFTTVGTGHIVPTTFKGRLLAITTGLIGIPLYALFLKHFGECILYINKRMIGLCEGCGSTCKNGTKKNTKIVFVSFFEMMLIIFLGALGAFPFDWPYFDGIYFCFISLSTVGFGDLIPDISGDKKIYGLVYMFYNVIGLAFVSCFICAVVNAIDDFNSMNEAVKWAARSLTHRSRTASKASSFHAELQQCDRSKTKLEHKGQQIDQSFFGGLSTIDPRATNNDTRWHENNGLSTED